MDPRHSSTTGNLTGLLRTWNAGDREAFEQLVPLVYDELHRIALRCLTGERSTLSLQATGLVNEVCLRLLGWHGMPWQSRGHFFGVSGRMMAGGLGDLASHDPRKASVVELRFFGGLSMEETAKTLGISLRTAQNDWAFARAWLH